jgi:hypothetical protein
VLGSYQVSGSQPANDPIDCGPDPFESNGIGGYEDGNYRICIDSPLESQFTNISTKIKPKN